MLIQNMLRQFCWISLLALCAALLAVVVLVVQNAGGETITVDDDGGADYETIQDAVDAAEDGDTVRVYEGTYEENVVVDKSIDLVGSGSAIIEAGDGNGWRHRTGSTCPIG